MEDAVISNERLWNTFSCLSRKNKAIFNLLTTEDFQNVPGTKESLEQAKEEFEVLFKNLEKILQEY